MGSPHTVDFEISGPIDVNSSVYIERQADSDAILYLQKMEYLKIIEPRQQGKTSFIVHLQSKFEGYIFCYVDMTTLNTSNEKEWYASLCPQILDELSFIPEDTYPKLPEKGSEWYQFLLAIAKQIKAHNHQVIIVLDEIGAAKLGWTEFFFSNIRAIYNKRRFKPVLNHLAFILAGAFKPRELVQDRKISPFNVARRVLLPDFKLEQIIQLVKYLNMSEDQTRTIATRVQYWTDGQPYLTQSLCHYLSQLDRETLSSDDVDRGVTDLLRTDRDHLPKIVELLEKRENLKSYTTKIFRGHRALFNPAGSHRHSDLEIIGIVKADTSGYCKIRNRIYKTAFQGTFIDSKKEEKNMSSHFNNGYALIVGVANYFHPKIRNLTKTVLKDAQDMRDLLISSDYCGYPETNTRLVLDDKATAENIRKELQWLANSASADSTALIFFSGHGGQIEEGDDAGNYLIPHDCDLDDMSTTAISDQEFTKLLRNIKAERLLVLFDCCHSGGVGELKKLITDQIQLKSGLNEQYYEQLSQGKGRVIIASSRSDELSRILSKMDNSLFTHYLLEALCGNGYHRGDGLIRVFDVFDYVSENVPEIAKKHPIKISATETDDSQHPVLKTHLETNFPISLFQGGQKTAIETTLSSLAPTTPPSTGKKSTAKKEDILNILYETYRQEGQNKWTSSGQILEDLDLTQNQLQDFILELHTEEFIEAKFMGKKALLKVTPLGVEIMK